MTSEPVGRPDGVTPWWELSGMERELAKYDQCEEPGDCDHDHDNAIEYFREQELNGLRAERDAANKRADAAERELAEVRERIGGLREEWGVRTYDSDDDTEVMRTREQAENLAAAWRTEIPNSNPTVRVRTQCAPGPWRNVEGGERKAADDA